MLPPTTLIPRDELSRLLDTMTPIEEQRITAEIPAVTADMPVVSRSRFVVVAISFAVTLVLGIVLVLA